MILSDINNKILLGKLSINQTRKILSLESISGGDKLYKQTKPIV